MEFSDIIASLRRRWRIGVGIFLLTLAVLAAFYVTRKESEPAPRFRGQVDVLVPTRGKEGEFPPGVPRNLFFGQAQLATTNNVKEQALANADIPTDLVGKYSFAFEQNGSGDLISLKTTAASSAQANALARGWGDAYLEARSEQAAASARDAEDRAYRGLQVSILRLDEIINELNAIDPLLNTLVPGVTGGGDTGPAQLRVPASTPIDAALLVYEKAQVTGAIDGARQEVVDSRRISNSPSSNGSVVQVSAPANITPANSSPQTPTFLILGIGLLLSLLVPVLIDRMDHTIRDAKTAAAAFSAPVLSSIPSTSRSRNNEIARPGTNREAAFRALAATSVATDRLPRSIVVTSALGDEQDSVAANFAAALAGLGVRVALIGTSPRQAWFAHGSAPADGDEASTFPQMLELAYGGNLNGALPRHLSRSSVEGLYVLPPGESDIDVATDGLAPMLRALDAANIDVTVIAAPAMLLDPNTTIYAWTTRSVLWVMETGEISVETARDAANRLTLAGVTPFGVAMVDHES